MMASAEEEVLAIDLVAWDMARDVLANPSRRAELSAEAALLAMRLRVLKSQVHALGPRISEALLDLHFVEDPAPTVASLRLGHVIERTRRAGG